MVLLKHVWFGIAVEGEKETNLAYPYIHIEEVSPVQRSIYNWLLEKKQLPPVPEPGIDPVQMIREHELRLNLSNPGADALSYDVLANTQG